jgi:hypothetical protein
MCSRYLDPQWGSPGTQSPCFGAPLGSQCKGIFMNWSIPCGQSFPSSNRANEVWLKSITVYCELYNTGYWPFLCIVCNGSLLHGEWRGMIYLQYLMGFYLVVQQSIIVQSMYYWNVCILVHCLEVLHKLLGSVYDEIDWSMSHKLCSLFGLHLYVILCIMVGGHC